MEFRDAVKQFRNELGITQVELANALHINTATVRRWELGYNQPSRLVVAMLMEYARKSGAPHKCVEMLKRSTVGAARNRLEKKNGSLFSVEHASLGQLIDDASFPIYVCDMESDELLYINHACETLLGGTLEQLKSRKCYACLMGRDSPCRACHKKELTTERFTTFRAFSPVDDACHLVQGKLIQWNGKSAHVRYIIDADSAVDSSEKSARASACRQPLSLRREPSGDAIAVAHYNLTRNTASDIASGSAACEKLLATHSLEDLLGRIRDEGFLDEDLAALARIGDRETMIRQFDEGRTQITARHYIEGVRGVFESSFDLTQNPLTDDIEAFVRLRDVTDRVMPTAIAKRLFEIDCQAAAVIDAESGEVHASIGRHRQDGRTERNAAGETVAGMEAYLRKYCADEDVGRVVRETSLPYIKQQLENRAFYSIPYSLRLDGKTVYQRAVYAYLDGGRKTILCATQDLSELHAGEDKKRNQLAEALQTLREQVGMDIARYDLRTETLYGNSAITGAAGYGSVIENVPEALIESGFVAPAYAEQCRAYFAQLRRGEAGSVSVRCRVGEGSLHWLHIDAQLLRNPAGEPYQAILGFRDIENEAEQATVYQTWRQELERRKQEDYTLYRCNLSRDASFDKAEGTLLKIQFTPKAKTFNDRTREYAGRFVHIDDFNAYTKLLNSENLLAGYGRGIHTVTMDYRERVSVDACQWLRVTVEMAQYPDSQDIEAFLMYERADAAHGEAAAEALHGTALENTNVVVVKCDWGKQQFTYDASISKYLLGRYDDRPLWEILTADGVMGTQDLKLMREMVHELAEAPEHTNGVLDLTMKTPSGAEHWFNLYVFKQVDETSGAVNIIMTFLDINDDVLSNRQLRFMAEHDSLTGLYNRDSFLKLVTVTLKDGPANAYVLGCSDINDFGFFNNRYGREEGDRLLQYSAERLRSYIDAKGGFTGRLSDDIFAFLLPYKEDMLEKTNAVVRDFFMGYPLKARLSGRAGFCVITDPHMKADTILDRAVIAKESIKGKYDKWVALYDESMNEAYLKEKYITDRMESALTSGQFDVYMQPQFHHATGQIVGAEALVRWIDPERGVVSPGEFIPVFEKNGFITRLDEFVWERAARYLHAWMEKGNKPVPLSVNVSREDMGDPNLCKKLKAIVERYGIPVELYRLEITESLFAEDPQHLIAVVDELHSAGFLVEMDDFGSGYSSLNILKDVPVDILKLDMRFFSGNDNLGRGGMIINAVLRMSRWLNIPVIAEGVESKDQADFLLSVGCPTIQGFLYEKPMPAAAFERLLSGDRQSGAAPQDLIDTELDARSFWNPTSVDSQVFNHFIGPAVVFEYHDGKYEIVRMNPRFAEATQMKETDVCLPGSDFANICEEDNPAFKRAVLDAIHSCADVKTHIRCAHSDGTKCAFGITLRVIAKSADRALIFAALDA